MNDEEAILNRLKQNQAYNDHIVSQQSKIIGQFNKVDTLSQRVQNTENQIKVLSDFHNNLKSSHNDLKDSYNTNIDQLKKSSDGLLNYFNNLNDGLLDFGSCYKAAMTEIFKNLRELREDLESFKARWLKEWVNLDNDLAKHKSEIAQQLKEGLEDNLKQIPETPPYIQDLKDTVTHKMRVFDIEVAKAVDKANHAEMLYKVVEKRTRA